VDALKSQGEIEAAVCDAVARFQQEYMGRGPRHVHTHLVDNKLFVHLEGVLTAAEQRLMDGHGNGNGRGAELLKQLRSHLVLAGKNMLDTLVRNATGSQPVSVHHDISPTTGEELLVFTLAAAPQCRCRGGTERPPPEISRFLSIVRSQHQVPAATASRTRNWQKSGFRHCKDQKRGRLSDVASFAVGWKQVPPGFRGAPAR
jgi:uncharacterized protein YbcI